MKSLGQSNITIAEGDKEKRKIEIGGVTYLVTAYYEEQSNMTVADKVARLIEKEVEIRDLFNEWHARDTSKKIKAVKMGGGKAWGAYRLQAALWLQKRSP